MAIKNRRYLDEDQSLMSELGATSPFDVGGEVEEAEEKMTTNPYFFTQQEINTRRQALGTTGRTPKGRSVGFRPQQQSGAGLPIKTLGSVPSNLVTGGSKANILSYWDSIKDQVTPEQMEMLGPMVKLQEYDTNALGSQLGLSKEQIEGALAPNQMRQVWKMGEGGRGGTGGSVESELGMPTNLTPNQMLLRGFSGLDPGTPLNMQGNWDLYNLARMNPSGAIQQLRPGQMNGQTFIPSKSPLRNVQDFTLPSGEVVKYGEGAGIGGRLEHLRGTQKNSLQTSRAKTFDWGKSLVMGLGSIVGGMGLGPLLGAAASSMFGSGAYASALASAPTMSALSAASAAPGGVAGVGLGAAEGASGAQLAAAGLSGSAASAGTSGGLLGSLGSLGSSALNALGAPLSGATWGGLAQGALGAAADVGLRTYAAGQVRPDNIGAAKGAAYDPQQPALDSRLLDEDYYTPQMDTTSAQERLV
jgi:hypothetical protein